MVALRHPFVFTIGSSVMAACGGDVVAPGKGAEGVGGHGGVSATSASSTGGDPSSGPSVVSAATATSTSASTSGQGGSTTATTATTGTGGNGPDCPSEPPAAAVWCPAPPGTTCSYDVSCQSGVRSLTFICGSHWEVVPGQPCAQPADSCPGTDYYCGSEWVMHNLSNPPAPCPASLPADGDTCNLGGFINEYAVCGYWCQDGVTWALAACDAMYFEPGQWSHSEPCDD